MPLIHTPPPPPPPPPQPPNPPFIHPTIAPSVQEHAFTVIAGFVNDSTLILTTPPPPPEFEILPKGIPTPSGADDDEDNTAGNGNGKGKGYIISPSGRHIGLEREFIIAAVLWGLRWRPCDKGPDGEWGKKMSGWQDWTPEEMKCFRDLTSVLMVWDVGGWWAPGRGVRRGVIAWGEREKEWERMRLEGIDGGDGVGGDVQEEEEEEEEGEEGEDVVVVDEADIWDKERELLFIEGLVTSVGVEGLAKMEGMWRGREAVWKAFGGWGGGAEDGKSRRVWWDSEMRIVRRAGEIHGRNYYAYSYARNLTTTVLTLTLPTPNEFHDLYAHILTTTLDHTLLHISDTSVLSFLGYILLWAPYPPSPSTDTTTSSTTTIPPRTQLILTTLTTLIDFLQAFIPPHPYSQTDAQTDAQTHEWGTGPNSKDGGMRGEAAWGLVRAVLGAGDAVFPGEEARKERREIVARIARLAERDGGSEQGVVGGAYRWIKRREMDE